MSLNKRAMSPLSKIRETRGFVTKKRVNDVLEHRAMHARAEYNRLDYKYSTPKPHTFIDRSDNVLAFGQKDFLLRTKPQMMENPHGLSDFDKLPRFHADKSRARNALSIEAEGLADKELWERNLPTNHRYCQIGDTSEKMPMSTQHLNGAPLGNFKNLALQKDEWASAYLELARTTQDDKVIGKPNFKTYCDVMKAEDKNK